MGLIDQWRATATSRPHVLIAEAPGAFRQRVTLESAVVGAGCSLTGTVADADVLAVVGTPGAELTAVIDRVWAQMSEPRARMSMLDGTQVAAALAEARDTLRSQEVQRSGARLRPRLGGHDGGDHHHGGNDGGGHDHGDMSPDGIPLAEGAEDRDGLEMDELHLPLGPVLPHWPTGVVVRLTLHGDVVAHAEVERLDAAPGRPPTETGKVRAARLLDAAASVLTLAGLPGEAGRVARLRDDCLDRGPDDVAAISERISAQAVRVRRHRILRWVVRALVITYEDGRREELFDRLVGLLDRARYTLDGGPAAPDRRGLPLEAVPGLVDGQDLAAVRLWMAALSADLVRDMPPAV